MNYEETMAYITETTKFGSNLGLERTYKILEFLGNPQDKIKCIHIAGTNGKGSTSAMINQILIENGYKVGLYISPYIECFEERMQINNVNIPKNRLCEVVEKVSEAVKKVVAAGYDHPTEFEIITCAMFLYFYEEKVDFGVIEVGLGGRLDSTNVITPILSVITSISYDHMNILGNTLAEIAYEKAGIIKEKIPVISYPQQEEALEVIQKVCAERNAKLTIVFQNSGEFIRIEDYKQIIEINTKVQSYEIKLPLLGIHQINNCSVVISAIEALISLGYNINVDSMKSALLKVKWKCRMEVLGTKPTVLVDGAHNIDGISKLSESIGKYFSYKKMYLIIGILADKQVDEMLRTITPMASRVFAVTPHSDRAEEADALKDRIVSINTNVEAFMNYEEAYKEALQCCEKEDLLVICGSLYMVGDMRKIIRGDGCNVHI
ncbi:bifunctional folylpolyglutamate synthase/dihydrofolate synthase [Clostridium sp. 19966]|uniref:bifunctional folylpolyglutamate synthase/dihydrofolate synthase n=1 Tax=Clostridium sp. 19966 TaxID=2768166 RepID=UPI0028DE9E06|nr:folylpolyglutamate synthase/dihydrofolate synthase family protein [Clostridium sp. 19966]MDT8716548.1 bifunctional folylpolyglutamate synthase/dihydrofolate synthase [Clostridium sp. 19966]